MKYECEICKKCYKKEFLAEICVLMCIMKLTSEKKINWEKGITLKNK